MTDDPPEYQHPETPRSLADALAVLQCQLPRIGKDETAQVPGKDGKRGYSYTYATLASISRQILPLLGMLGMSFTCCPTMHEGQFVLHYRLALGEDYLEGFYPLPSSGTPQTVGGAITYARRYALCAVTGLAPDDDDDDAQAAEDSAARIIDEVRAMRRKDPEVDEHGAATLAEQTRMITGREPGVHRSKDAVVDDRWTTDAPSWLVGVDPPEDQPGSILPAQRSQIMAVYTALGIKDRDKRIEDVNFTLGALDLNLAHPVESVNDLSHQQAARLLENLHERHTGKMTHQ